MKTGDAETGSKVLEFYKEHPFNYRETIKEHVKAIKCQNSVNAYPELQKLLEKKKTTIFEVGCGVGWLSNALAYHHKCLVIGLDFNPVAIDRANSISRSLKQTSISTLVIYSSLTTNHRLISLCPSAFYITRAIARVPYVGSIRNLLNRAGMFLSASITATAVNPFSITLNRCKKAALPKMTC